MEAQTAYTQPIQRWRHLHRSGSDPISTSRRSGALSSSGSTTDETIHRAPMRSGWRQGQGWIGCTALSQDGPEVSFKVATIRPAEGDLDTAETVQRARLTQRRHSRRQLIGSTQDRTPLQQPRLPADRPSSWVWRAVESLCSPWVAPDILGSLRRLKVRDHRSTNGCPKWRVGCINISTLRIAT